jgi:hypothetical protein
MSIQDQLKTLEKEKARLVELEKNLLEQAKAQKEIDAKLEAIVKQSGLEPRDLVFALVDKFGVRLAGRRKGSKRGRRRRTKITAELRDAVKNERDVETFRHQLRRGGEDEQGPLRQAEVVRSGRRQFAGAATGRRQPAPPQGWLFLFRGI